MTVVHILRNKLIMLGLAALIGLLSLLISLPEANAFPSQAVAGAHCQIDNGFWFTKGTRRTICDTARRADGSWTRYREFWTPAHQIPLTCNTYGSGGYGGFGYSNTNCFGGYFQPQTSNGVEDYPVNDGDVLPDEPPWISV